MGHTVCYLVELAIGEVRLSLDLSARWSRILSTCFSNLRAMDCMISAVSNLLKEFVWPDLAGGSGERRDFHKLRLMWIGVPLSIRAATEAGANLLRLLQPKVHLQSGRSLLPGSVPSQHGKNRMFVDRACPGSGGNAPQAAASRARSPRARARSR